nr:hypothetical protein Iba_chr04fCG12890 [Ipomoea batatas]
MRLVPTAQRAWKILEARISPSSFNGRWPPVIHSGTTSSISSPCQITMAFWNTGSSLASGSTIFSELLVDWLLMVAF